MLIVHQFARILFQVQPFDTDAAGFAVFQIDVDVAVGHNRMIGLRNLVSVGQVGVIVVFARENRHFVDRRVNAQTRADRLFDTFVVDDGEHAGEARVDETDLRVGFSAERRRRAGKQFRFGNDFAVHFQSDDDFPIARFTFNNIRHLIFLLRAKV